MRATLTLPAAPGHEPSAPAASDHTAPPSRRRHRGATWARVAWQGPKPSFHLSHRFPGGVVPVGAQWHRRHGAKARGPPDGAGGSRRGPDGPGAAPPCAARGRGAGGVGEPHGCLWGVRPAGSQTPGEAASILALWQAPRALAGGLVRCRPSRKRWATRRCQARSWCHRRRRDGPSSAAGGSAEAGAGHAPRRAPSRARLP